MNRILMDDEKIVLSNETSFLVKGINNVIYINNIDDDINLDITMEDNTELLILDFNIKSKTTNIVINQSNNAKVNYIHSFKITGIYNFNYLANIKGNNNINNINIKGITSGNVNMNVDGNVIPNTKGNELNEDIKVLNLGGKVYSSPMLHISTLDVIANHNTAISNIREDELFYLNSKGISDMGAITLIQDGYLYGIFKEYQDFYKLIKDN